MQNTANENLASRVAAVEASVASMQGRVTDHFHNGSDASLVNFRSIAQKKVLVPWTLPGATAAVAANYSTFFTAAGRCSVTGLTEVHCVAGTDSGSVTLQLEHLTGTLAPGSGTGVLSAVLSLRATVNTVRVGTLVQGSVVSLAAGDRLALLLGGTPTSVANVTVVVELTLI